MILIIDNYDSFTYNLVQYVGTINENLKVIKNDALALDAIKAMNLSHIIISPGPGKPQDTGMCLNIINDISPFIPTLGICLGHQAIAYQYNAKIVNSKNIIHGETSVITHNNKSILFKDIPTILMPHAIIRYVSIGILPTRILILHHGAMIMKL